ncbi:hypothetical protein ACE6H2_020331 [Prunus campanulata]
MGSHGKKCGGGALAASSGKGLLWGFLLLLSFIFYFLMVLNYKIELLNPAV